MEIFHVGDKVFLDDIKDYEYGKIIDIEHNRMTISPISNKIDDKLGLVIHVHMDSPHIHKIDFLPKEKVVIHDLLKDYYNKRGVVSAYDSTIDRYRVMINNESHWFAPFELRLEDESEHFVALFSSSNPIKVTLSDEGKRAYKYHFNMKAPVDTNGRTEFANLEQLMEVYDSTFIYGDKYLLEDDKILVKAAD
mgnify:CR=1 FL=1